MHNDYLLSVECVIIEAYNNFVISIMRKAKAIMKITDNAAIRIKDLINYL